MIRKTSKAVPRSEIEIAKQRWQDFKDRMGARPRKPPRAAGQDAP
jgi:phage-related protein